MSEFDQLIAAAFESGGKQEQVNKVYLGLLKTRFYLPVRKQDPAAVNEEEPFIPLYTQQDDHYLMPIFSTLERLQTWAGDYMEQMEYVELVGWDVVRGLGEQVYLCVNFGTPFYKEFAPDEVKRLKLIVQRLMPPDEAMMQ